MNNLFPSTTLCLFSWSLVILLVIRFYFPTRLTTSKKKIASLVAIAILISTPLHGPPLVYYPRSLFGDFSLSTMFLIVLAALRPQTLDHHRKKQLLCGSLVVLASGLLLYPATLGLSLTDPYQWGFNPRWMIATVGVIVMISWLFQQWILASMLTVATLSFTLQLLESTNYWDYLIDPVLFIASLYFVVVNTISYTRRTKEPIQPASQ